MLEPQARVGVRPAVEGLPPDGRDPRQRAEGPLAGTDDRRAVVVDVEHHERSHQNQLQQLERHLADQLRFTRHTRCCQPAASHA